MDLKLKITLSIFLGSAGLVYFLFNKHRNKLRKISNMDVITDLSAFGENDRYVIKELHKKHGDIFISSLWAFDVVHVANPDILKVVLKEEDNIPKLWFPSPKHMSVLQKGNIITTSGEEWERHKSVVKSSFEPDALASYYPSFLEIIRHLVDKLDLTDLSNEIDLAPWIVHTTMDILGKTIFDFNYGSLDNQNEVVVNAYNEYMEHVANPIWALFPQLEHIPIPFTKHMKQSVDITSQMLDILIKEKLERKKKGLKSENPCMLDYAIDSVYVQDGILSESELKSDAFVFLLAGHETTATAITWGLYLLATNPDVQEKVYEEVRSVLNGRVPTQEDLKNMPYLSRTIKEILRYEPPAFQLPTRGAIKNIAIEGTDYTIPSGCAVSIMFRQLHHDPRYWPEPEKFDPDRFLPENSKGRHPFCYVPFSLGKRMCIGMQFSLIEQYLLLSMLVQKFKFSPGKSSIKKKQGILNTPKYAYFLIERR